MAMAHKRSYPSRVQWHKGMGRCTKKPYKRCYPCRKAARTARRVIGAGTIYRCETCGSYHISSYPPRVAAAIRMLLDSLAEDRARIP